MSRAWLWMVIRRQVSELIKTRLYIFMGRFLHFLLKSCLLILIFRQHIFIRSTSSCFFLLLDLLLLYLLI